MADNNSFLFHPSSSDRIMFYLFQRSPLINFFFILITFLFCNLSLWLFLSRRDDLPVHGLSETVVGVLGGGQLGRMLCQAASEMAIKINVLDPLENCPANSISNYHMVGSFDDSVTVQEFAKRLDLFGVDVHIFLFSIFLLYNINFLISSVKI